MSVGIERLITSALGLQAPWGVQKFALIHRGWWLRSLWCKGVVGAMVLVSFFYLSWMLHLAQNPLKNIP
jgi:hypothetical protein